MIDKDNMVRFVSCSQAEYDSRTKTNNIDNLSGEDSSNKNKEEENNKE